MPKTFEHPDLSKRFDAIREALQWASRVDVVWRDQNDGGRVKEPLKTWAELRPTIIAETGYGDVRSVDLETPLTEGTLQWPRQEVSIAWYNVTFEAMYRSRVQDYTQSGIIAAALAKTKLRQSHVLTKWLRPNISALIDIGDAVNMPETKVFDGRTENIAMLMFSIAMTLCETDATNVGTWIDRCLVSSNLTPMDDSLQLQDEVMGWPDETVVVDSNGTVVTAHDGLIVTKG
jgi:hypothetical protein